MKRALAIAGLLVLVSTASAKPLPPGCRAYCPLLVTAAGCHLAAQCPRRCLLAVKRCEHHLLKHLYRQCRRDPSVCPPPTTTTTSTTTTTTTPLTVTVGPGGQLVFDPATLTIKVGDTVHWVWATAGHSVVSGTNGTTDNQFCSPNNTSCGNPPLSLAGATYDHTFTTAGTFPYYCSVHFSLGMTGTITVQ